MEHGVIQFVRDGQTIQARVDEEGFHTGNPDLDAVLDGQFFGKGVRGDPVVRAICEAAEQLGGTILQCPEPDAETVTY